MPMEQHPDDKDEIREIGDEVPEAGRASAETRFSGSCTCSNREPPPDLELLAHWPYRWYGFWSETEGDYSLPSLHDFVDPSWDRLEREKVACYLQNGLMFIGSLCGCRCRYRGPGPGLSLSWGIETDGEWFWPND